MRYIYVYIILLVSTAVPAVAQHFRLDGTIRDERGQPVPFASIHLKNTSRGTSANVDGQFMLLLTRGKYTLEYRAIGYKPLLQDLSIDSNLSKTITLTTESYSLQGVTISAGAEDPAYAIIREAIKKRKFHLREVKAYTCDVYIKGLQKLVGAPKRFFGKDIQKTLDLDTNRKGILYLSESQSKFSHQRPDKIREEMISSKIAGHNNAFSFNKASDLLINFYENILLEQALTPRGFISPIADNALFYYKYKLLGTTQENGRTINKIEVIPRRQNDPVFRGTLYIADDVWNLTGTNLHLTKDAGINLLDTLTIAQQFFKADEKTYMPSNISLRFNGKVLGFRFAGHYLGVYSAYNLNPVFPKGYFNGEILKVPESVNKKDSIYWAQNRPIPLTPEEEYDYHRKDSVARRKQSRLYLDSVEQANNVFGMGKLLVSGYSINHRYGQKAYTFDPILRGLFYNTVEGFGIRYGVTYRKEFENYQSYAVRPELRYGTATKMLSGMLTSSFTYNRLKRASVGITLGSGIYDLNRYGTMSLLSNSVNSLLFETNHSKFFQKNFAGVWSTRELANGLQGMLMLEFGRNKALVNNTEFRLLKKEKPEQGQGDFTSNNPFTPGLELPLFPDYNAFTLTSKLSYTPGRTYITRPDGKYYQPAKFPTFEVSYRTGLKGILNSDVDYHLLSMEIFQEKLRAGMLGYTALAVGGGKFFGRNTVYYPDFQHFRGNNSLFATPVLRRFQFLDFYLYSTDAEYLEGHIEHNFAGFMTNKLPLLRKLKLEEIVGANYLTQPTKKHYTEFYFGFQRLIFRATYGFAYDGKRRVDHGFRLSYGF